MGQTHYQPSATISSWILSALNLDALQLNL
jgi:hypothetical protein